MTVEQGVVQPLRAGIARLQQRVDADSNLRAAMDADHREHIALRDSYLSTEERDYLAVSGLTSALAERGIGGIADFGRIRCLHTWYAAHLVAANTIGRLLDDHWAVAAGEEGSIHQAADAGLD